MQTPPHTFIKYRNDPSYPLACIWLCVTYVLGGQLVEARRYAEQAFSLVPSPTFMGVLAGVARRGGDQRRTDPLVARLRDGDAPGTWISLALYHMMCLDIEQALAYFAAGHCTARRDGDAAHPVPPILRIEPSVAGCREDDEIRPRSAVVPAA